MSAYWPNNWRTIGDAVGLFAFEVLAGWVLNRYLPRNRYGRLAAWLMTVAGGAAVVHLTAAEPPGVRMVAIILGLFFGLKAIVGVEAGAGLGPLRWLGFSLLWFGMRPGIFARGGSEPRRGARQLLFNGLARFVLGVVLVLTAQGVWNCHPAIGDVAARWLATMPLLLGLSLMLHFGFFNMLAGFWRALGVDARPLFRSPLLSTSLEEFWSKRWNLAFSEMTALAVYRPAAAMFGRRGAVAAAFIVSGLLHELAISVPVRAGFGGPSCYFLLHGALVLIENRWRRRGTPVNVRPWLGRAWTLLTLALPLPILFHPPFLAGVIWPLIGIE